MARFTALFTTFVLLAASASAVPLQHSKRIAQTTIDAPQKWRDACNAANGGGQCTDIAVTAAATLLAAAGPCDQQNSGDAMIDLAKQLNNNQDMINAAKIFVQQPRNSPNSVSTPYCEQAPKNAELNGLFQCQFQGADPNSFGNGLKVGDAGTIPFGLKSLSPLGSCPANPSGPIADGTQLSDITSSPGTPSSSSGSSGSSGSSSSTAGSGAVSGTASAAASSATASSTDSGPASSASAAASSPASSGSSSSTGFQAQNAKDAQALNAKFATLTASSSCNDGDQACVNGGFAQCVGGQFQITQCSGGTQCFALPLVNKAGTSITCDTAADAAARISATGVSGGVDGSGATSASSSSTASNAASSAAANDATTTKSTAASSGSSSSGFQAQNAKDAQALNAKFATLTASSSCTDGDQACVNGGFAQCVGGQFQVTQCSGSTQCFALPLVNKAGTSITCDTAADAAARISATGVSGGVDGSS